ncbi:ABC transporter, ATP-binding protein [Teladorsagia circumcincta]|uniref:ABC-type xenobiotic transporter n=1 Tax=Teladorsagia circumcincta TaxID=45464 RepID=A0A2G9T367_TELCI|nr:ABC transporter, ATP-binding protein [Teladorsagia circumcincta]
MRGASFIDYAFLLTGIVFSIVNGAILPFNSLIFRGMADTLIAGERNHSRNELDIEVFSSNVLFYCGLYLGLGVALLAVGYIANASLYTMCERRIHIIRAKYLRAVMRQDMTWFDQQQTGALTMKMSSGMERIKDGIGDKLGLILGAFGSFVGGNSLGFYLSRGNYHFSWRMTLVMLITVPLLMGATQVSGKLLSRASKMETYAYSSAAALANEVIAGIRTVMAFNAQPFEIHRMGDDSLSDADVEEACKVANALGFIRNLSEGFNTVIGEGAVQLSGGQKQRIAIARALVRNPQILLLDEATSALDTESEHAVQKALDKARENRTTICIAHRLSTIRDADKIIVFDEGHVVEQGTHDELMAVEGGVYQGMVKAQAIDKGEEDTTLDVGSEEDTHRVEMARESARLRQSMISTSTQEPDWEIERLVHGFPMAGIALIFTLLRGLTWPLFSIIYGKLFLILNSIFFLLLAIGSGITTFASGSLFGITGEKMAMRLRMDVFKNIMRQDASYFDNPNHNTGNLTAHLASDTPNVQAVRTFQPCRKFVIIMTFFAQSSVAQYLKFRGQRDMESAVEASQIVTESISNTRTIQALCKEGYMYEAYCAAAQEPHKRALVRGLWQALSLALSNSFVVVNFAIAYAFGLWLIRNEWSTPFIVFQVIEALNMASMSVMMAASYFPEYIRARISAGVMFTMMRQRPKIDNMSHQGDKPALKGDIALRNVYFSYPVRRRQLVLQGMNLSVRHGQTVALVGASGCGKSTVIQLVERYYDALCGTVSIDTYDIRDLSIRYVRDNMALVGQEPTLFNVTIRENIMYGLDKCSQEEIEHAARLANIHDFINSLPERYNTVVGAKGALLSGGQKQRIAIARAIVRDPKILLLDEATSALDTESEKVVQEALDRARLGRTCLVIAHRLSTIQNADNIVVCRDGRVAEHGTHQALMARKGIYYKLVERQNR